MTLLLTLINFCKVVKNLLYIIISRYIYIYFFLSHLIFLASTARRFIKIHFINLSIYIYIFFFSFKSSQFIVKYNVVANRDLNREELFPNGTDDSPFLFIYLLVSPCSQFTHRTKHIRIEITKDISLRESSA